MLRKEWAFTRESFTAPPVRSFSCWTLAEEVGLRAKTLLAQAYQCSKCLCLDSSSEGLESQLSARMASGIKRAQDLKRRVPRKGS